MDLLKAVQSGSLKDVEDAMNSDGIIKFKALNTALANGNVDIAKFLLSQNCRVNRNTSSEFESSPLHKAVELKNVDLVKLLLQRKASVMAVTKGGNTPLHLAFIAGLSEIVSLLVGHIEEISEFTNCKNKFGLSHLHIACTTKHSKVIENYIKKNANIEDSVNMDSPKWAGYTAFHFAVKYRSVCATKTLSNFQRHGDRKKDNNGYTAWELARIQLVEDSIIMESMAEDYERPFILRSEDLPSAFHLACMRGDHQLVQLFLERGTPVNDRVSEHIKFCPLYTPLHFAVESRSKKIVELLLENGADLSLVNGYNMTALHLAMYLQDRGIIFLLYYKTEDKEKNLTDDNKLSYFHVAVSRNNLELVKKMLKNERVDVNMQVSTNHRGFSLFTPLHFAVQYQHKTMVELLIEHGADLNVVSSEGTALQMALELTDWHCDDHHEMVELLFKHGADLNVVSCKGTALQVALKLTDWRQDLYGPNAFDWLLDNDAKVDVIVDQKTLLHRVVLRAIEMEDELRDKHGDSYADETVSYDVLSFYNYVGELIKLGCDVNAKDEHGNTALHLAVAGDSGGCSRALVKNGADVNVENDKGQCPSLFTSYSLEPESEAVYDHVQNMRALGWKVHPKLEKTCASTLKEMENKRKCGLPGFRENWPEIESEQKEEKEKYQHDRIIRSHRNRLDEVEKMKKLKLDEKTTLYDFMRLDDKEAGAYANNEILKSIVLERQELKGLDDEEDANNEMSKSTTSDDEMLERFSVYGYLIELQYRKSQKYADANVTEKRKNKDTEENLAKRKRAK